ncbi:MAG: class II fructose-bisphosphate aldolase [Clostridia bacterium]|nr:class II fructose-bisphosphate aldolase [Clostridia bacterium]MDO5478938.1 class II fructose-bisphosphate aldolase [Clostridia bacterium]
MLVSFKTVLDMAEKGNFAIPAFNVYNMETVMGVIRAAERQNAPVILQNYSRLVTNEEGYFLAPIIIAAAKQASVPVCYHLDHGASEVEVMRTLRYGATGIMIDKSALPMEENIAGTKNVVELCKAVGVEVEGEIGHVGSAANGDEQTTEYTTVEEAKAFVEGTGVTALAIAVGTAHGRYKKAPKLAIERIAEIHKNVDVALVLHGGSGVPDEEIKASINAGIRKINFGTDLCYAFLDQVFATGRDKVGIDLFMKEAVEAVASFAEEKIKLLGADNKA